VRNSAMCVGGPPKPMQPMRVHSRAISPSEGGDSELATGIAAAYALPAGQGRRCGRFPAYLHNMHYRA
jgi:hypothetical protein